MDTNKSKWESIKTVHFYKNRKDNSLYLPEQMIFQEIEHLNRKSLLDIGIGTGRTTAMLHNKVAYYFGIDYSMNMVETCRNRFKTSPKLFVEYCDATDLSRFTDESFDLVFFSFNGIDYINNLNKRNASLLQMYRILRPGGHLIFSSHNYYHISEYFRFPRIRFQYAFFKEIVKFILIPLYNRRFQRFLSFDYTLFNDGALNFGLNTFYIKPEYQIELLKNIGFIDIAVINLKGKRVSKNYHETKNDYFLYYRSLKNENSNLRY